MNRKIATPIRRKRQQGYALLLVVFLVTVLAMTAIAAAPNVLTEGKREKEEEMIWRGKQYVRAIKLYYRKNNRFPTELEDLYKQKQLSIRYLRQPYKDPMNKEDGTWRLIYVGPAGNLIGSLKPSQRNLQLPGAQGFGTPAGQPSAPGGIPALSSGQGSSPLGPQAGPGGAPGAPGGPAGTNGAGQGSQQPGDASAQADLPAQAASGDTPTIMGGKIIGVGSKVNQRSVRIYDKAKNYRLFEFIWDPSKDSAAAFGQPGMQTGTGFGTPAGAGPASGIPALGSQPGNGAPQTNPNSMPPTSMPPTAAPQNQ